MKNLFLFLVTGFITLFVISCSGKSEKFLGKWKVIPSTVGQPMGTTTIQKSGDLFESVPDQQPFQKMTWEYDPKRDVLISQDGSMELHYLPEKKHLQILPHAATGWTPKIELEKVD